MLQSWRWFGPEDPVTLDHVRQAGASGIVTALHHIYDGRAWTADDVAERRALVERAGLTWSVCESIPVPSAVKLRSGDWRAKLDNWITSLRNLGRGGVPTVCYNFMPVVDWTRTDLRYPLATTGLALRFDMAEFVAYDALVLRRRGGEADYPDALIDAARAKLGAMSESEVARLERTVIAGLPGGEETYDRATIARRIAEFAEVGDAGLRANLAAFLQEIAPVAEEVGVRLAIHPDDPPFPLFGLPRVVSTAADLRAVLGATSSAANGLTFCTGSLGSRRDNDVPTMAAEFAPRIHFAHLRNVAVEDDASFVESEHLAGDVDMIGVVEVLIAEERRRARDALPSPEIPMRPDHGHLLADDIEKATHPGYSLVGRLKGLAELRGVMLAVGRFRPN